MATKQHAVETEAVVAVAVKAVAVVVAQYEARQRIFIYMDGRLTKESLVSKDVPRLTLESSSIAYSEMWIYLCASAVPSSSDVVPTSATYTASYPLLPATVTVCFACCSLFPRSHDKS